MKWTDEDGDVFLSLIQNKTGNEVEIPVSALLLQTLNKYNFVPPAICLSSLDRRIKVIARKAGINSTVPRDPTKAERAKGIVGPIMVPKYTMIASHTCRRTAATLMSQSKQFNTSEIMDMTGHRSESELLKYIRTTKKQRAKDISKKEYFKNAPLRIAK